MITIKINIPTWSDFRKWFWDTIAFPRRKTVTEWMEQYTYYVFDLAEQLIIDAGQLDIMDNDKDLERLANMHKKYKEEVKKLERRIIDDILKYK